MHRLLKSERGQASVEYLVVGVALLVFIAGVAALWRYASGGAFANLAADHASHASNGVGGLVDALLY